MPTNQEIFELWHLARAGGHSSRYDRMIYVKKELEKIYTKISPKTLWLKIEDVISNF